MAEVEKQNPLHAGEMAQRFVQFVMIQAQNIMFVLGRIPSPDGMAHPPNLEAAKMLIDQLEMIKEKTRGNTSKQEDKILEEALQAVRLAFVEASGGTPASMMPSRGPQFNMDEMLGDEDEEELHEPAPPAPQAAKPAQAPEPKAPSAAPEPSKPEEDAAKKKYFKSYG